MADAQTARKKKRKLLHALHADVDRGHFTKLKTTSAHCAGVKWMKTISMIKLLNFKRLNKLL